VTRVMTVYSFFQQRKSRLIGGALMAVLLCGATGLSFAQEEAVPAEQLPPDFAQEQIPPSFPGVGGEEVQTIATPAAAAPQTTTTPASQDGAAQTPPAEEIPAAPATQQLVPATPMGTAAQQNAAPDAQEQQPALAAETDQQAAPAQPPAQGLPDILDKYTQATEDAGGMPSDEFDVGNDALPQVPQQAAGTMGTLKIQGEGFEMGNRSATVPIDGALNEESNAKLQEEIRSEAYDAAITGMFPLAPNQIEELLQRYDQTQEAAKTPPYDNPKPEISVQNISLDPGVAPPVIKTAIGNVTTLNILDATGAPWPVQDVTWAGDYEIVEPEQGGHIIRITPMSHFARGNIVIRMLTLKTPLTLTLETGRDVVQYRVDARIPEYGPFATTPIMQGGKSLVAGTPELTSILDGTAPGNAVKLDVSGVDGRTTAYSMGGTTYVRTPLTLLSPAWQSSVSSADGMNVYALTNAPVLLLSDGGEFQRAILKEKEDLLDE
jgi:intracellular multiplication protein IcmK